MLNEALRFMLLNSLRLQAQVTAMRILLKDYGIATSDSMPSAMEQSMREWGPSIERVEKMDLSKDESHLLEFLKNFEGPLQ